MLNKSAAAQLNAALLRNSLRKLAASCSAAKEKSVEVRSLNKDKEEDKTETK